MSAKHQKEAGRLLAMAISRGITLGDCATGIQHQFEQAESDAHQSGVFEGLVKAKKLIEDYPDTDTPISDFTEAITSLAEQIKKGEVKL